ncbi:MAG: hemolysin family protein [Candidatus Nanopelagicales bacterium]|nr:hemolysin family protein [Candidatus Nanopelagicales bacterium]
MPEPLVLVVVAVALVVASWLLVAAETAISRLSRASVDELRKTHERAATRVDHLVRDRVRSVNALLLARTATMLTAVIVVAAWLVQWSSWSPAWNLIVATAFMTAVTYVVLDVSARTVGRQHPAGVAAGAAPVVRALVALLSPITALLILLGNAITPGRGFREGPFASQAEFLEMVDAAGAADVIADDERQMIQSVFQLGGTIAREVMVPRTEMVFIERSRTLAQGLSLCLRSGFSRIPVAGESLDEIVGVVLLKDLVGRMLENRDGHRSERIDSRMRKAHFVPDSKPADELLREMQADREHMAIVVDEFGGTAGLVTIEDILEEIVGEIADEYDTEEPEVVELPDGGFRVRARLTLEHLAALTGMDLDPDAEGVETVGGLMASRLGLVPIPGAKVDTHGWRLTAESTAGRRNLVDAILVERLDSVEHEHE